MVAVAFGSAAPQLGVAEFAPAARQDLDPPPTSAAPDGSGAGSSGSRRSTTTTAAASPTASDPGSLVPAPTSLVGRARPCYGSPPRQTQDPLSPPCIPTIYEGDNGGATSKGVTATEIRVAVPVDVGFTTATGGQRQAFRDALTAVFAHVNQSFELYGRRLVPVLVEGAANNAVGARALGTAIAAESVFAATTNWLEVWRQVQIGLIQEVARNGIVTVTRNGGSGWSNRGLFDPLHPYVWSVSPALEQNLENLSHLACSLAGRPAAHAVGASLRTKTRRFAIVAGGRESTPSVTNLAQALTECAHAPATMHWIERDDASGEALRTGLSRLQADGATTVICVCEFRMAYTPIAPAAYGLGFDPEWLIAPTNTYSDEHWTTVAWDRPVSMVRLEPGPRLLPVQNRPWYGALLSTRPDLLAGETVRYAFQVAPPLYEGMMILAAGIQGAGPTLTPETFAAALMSTSFPNPGTGTGPYWQPSVGFGPGDHAFYDNYEVAWWSASAPTIDSFVFEPTGSWCYVGGGRRSQARDYAAPLDSALFNADLPCR